MANRSDAMPMSPGRIRSAEHRRLIAGIVPGATTCLSTWSHDHDKLLVQELPWLEIVPELMHWVNAGIVACVLILQNPTDELGAEHQQDHLLWAEFCRLQEIPHRVVWLPAQRWDAEKARSRTGYAYASQGSRDAAQVVHGLTVEEAFNLLFQPFIPTPTALA